MAKAKNRPLRIKSIQVILMALIVLLVGLTSYYLGYNKYNNSALPQTVSNINSDWKTYISKNLSISFRYPTDYEIQETEPNQVSIGKTVKREYEEWGGNKYTRDVFSPHMYMTRDSEQTRSIENAINCMPGDTTTPCIENTETISINGEKKIYIKYVPFLIGAAEFHYVNIKPGLAAVLMFPEEKKTFLEIISSIK